MKRRYILLIASISIMCSLSVAYADEQNASIPTNSQVKLLKSVKSLFSHEKHKNILLQLGTPCQDCHTFSIVPEEKAGPLSKNIDVKFLQQVPKKVCHRCHIERVNFQRRNQCSLCHIDLNELKPKDHLLDWKRRHGKAALIDRDSCSKCHKETNCTKCHLGRDTMNQIVHRGNFRLTHSVEARMKPASCMTCHQSANFCYDCHSGKRR